MRWIFGIVDRIFVGVAGICMLQLPSFVRQYMGYLQGRVDELGLQIESYRSVAAQGGKTIKEFVSKFLSSADSEIASQGKLMEENLVRFDQMSGALAQLKDSFVWDRGLRFIQNMDTEYIKAVWGQFQPSLDFSVEAIVYGCIGVVAAFLVTRVLKRVVFGKKSKFSSTDFI